MTKYNFFDKLAYHYGNVFKGVDVANAIEVMSLEDNLAKKITGLKGAEYKRPFEEWDINHYHAKSPDGKFSLWIANGLSHFRDEGYPFVDGLDEKEKELLLRQITAESNMRAADNRREYGFEKANPVDKSV